MATASPKAVRSSDDHLKSLVKLVRVLECFSTNDRALTLAEICQRTGFPRSTTHRLLASLREVGFLEQDRERDRYRLGLKLFELGNTALSNFDLHREARPYVEALRQMTGQTVHLAVFDGYRAVVIRRADPAPDNAMPVTSTFIENAPAHCTSVGKAILAWQPEEAVRRLIDNGLEKFTVNTITDEAQLRAELEKIRERGYSIDEAEHQPGLRCVGAPIRNQSGVVFAGLSISGPAWKLPVENVEELSKVVIHHADQISRSLGYH
ncbi:MAG: transcriptional regulator [Pelagibacterium sp. SCN 64-44]|nr:MAG: transcriptional regulator [Pelagibacterium sp. SCN 64-44]